MTMLNAAIAAQPEAALLQRFCSLGENCEFGAVQRHFGAEPADLLRWAAIELDPLLRLLRAGCAGMDNTAQLRVTVDGAFYWGNHDGYGFRWHGLNRVGTISAQDMLTREAFRMARLAERLLAELGEAERIFVVKQDAGLSRAQALAVRDAMGEFGDATLLYVTPADPAQPAGCVRWEAERLLHGTLAQFADRGQVLRGIAPEAWLQLCRQAQQLVDAGPG